MLSQNFDKLLYSHTKRNSNFVAHHNLAKYTIGIPNFLVCGWKISYHTSFLFYNLIRLIYIKKISKVFTQKNKNKKTRPIILYHALFLQDYQITSPHKNLYLLNQQNSISQRFAILPVRKKNYFFCFFFLEFFFWYKLN